MICTLGKGFLAAATFKGSWDVYFQTEKKFVVYFRLYESSLPFSRREDQIDSVCGKEI